MWNKKSCIAAYRLKINAHELLRVLIILKTIAQ